MSLRPCLLGVMALAALGGCHTRQDRIEFDPLDGYLPYATQIEYPDAAPESWDAHHLLDSQAPPTVRRPEEVEKWPLTLEEATRIALANSQVIRRLGGLVVNTPDVSTTIYDPAIVESSPLRGVEAALAAFDAQFTTALFHEQRDRGVNNEFQRTFGAFTTNSDFELALTKVAATGTQFGVRNITTYNRIHNFQPGFNQFASVYDMVMQAEVRQPLLQGAGVEFNRIAGPFATPGNYNGVLLARINTDVSLAEFEASVRDLLRDVERTYWELYFAYRDFDAKVEGRRLARESWELEKRRADAGTRTADQEAFAREQFYAAQAAVENALSGLANGTGGVYAIERDLRRLLGLPPSDGKLIVPVDEPTMVDVRFDWQESLMLALMRRVELRRQQWNIKRRELELIAARNFTRMQADLVGQYRWRGFGDDLFGEDGTGSGSAFESLFDGNLQDWRFGIEVATPVGNRIGHTAVRNAELWLAREHAMLNEIELQISHELRGAFTELDRAHAVARSRYNQRIASLIRLRAEERRNALGQAQLDLVLDAQRQFVLAESNYYRAVVDYNLALMQVNWTRGTLLDYLGVSLTEGPWVEDAHVSAARLARCFREKRMDYCLDCPPIISQGEYPQHVSSPGFSRLPAP